MNETIHTDKGKKSRKQCYASKARISESENASLNTTVLFSYSLHVKGALKCFQTCVYVSSGKSSVITYIKKHGQIQKDNNSEKI